MKSYKELSMARIPGLLALMFLPVFGDNGRAVLWGGFLALALATMAVQSCVGTPSSEIGTVPLTVRFCRRTNKHCV